MSVSIAAAASSVNIKTHLFFTFVAAFFLSDRDMLLNIFSRIAAFSAADKKLLS